MRCEVLIDPQMFPRGERMLKAMIETSPIQLRVSESYVGDCEILMVYGTGHPVRRPWQQQHLRNGGRLIGWDLGYWHREINGTFTMRCTLDGDHPQAFIRPEAPQRWDAAGIQLREDARPGGPVVVVGLGPKSLRAHGLGVHEFENRAIARARAAFPGREVLFRPKRPTDPRIPRVKLALGPIERVLRGASLVICRHSNVAIDACIAGVPVVCEDGAAAAIYGRQIESPAIVTREQRLEFLRSLAWWQWKPSESSQAWTYLLQRLSA